MTHTPPHPPRPRIAARRGAQKRVQLSDAVLLDQLRLLCCCCRPTGYSCTHLRTLTVLLLRLLLKTVPQGDELSLGERQLEAHVVHGHSW